MEDKKDNWNHRNTKMKCRTCMWFVKKQTERPVSVDEALIGRCRRHSPTMNGFPVTYETDWCGDHKIDENK